MRRPSKQDAHFMGAVQRLQKTCLAGLVLALSTACVHTDVKRTGRMALGGGQEGLAPVVAKSPLGYEEVAVITVDAAAISTAERRTRHLQRRASLLGCDAVTNVRHAEVTVGTCLRQQDGVLTASVDHDNAYVLPASRDLVSRVAATGDRSLLKLLRRLPNRPQAERLWTLRWYLENYPASPFRADVEAMFVTADNAFAAAGAGARTAPTDR